MLGLMNSVIPESPISTSQSSATTRDPLASLRIQRGEGLATPRTGRRRHWWPVFLLLLVGGVSFAAYRIFGSGEASSWLGSLGIRTSDWVPDVIQKRPEVRLVTVQKQIGRSADAVVVATGYVESRRQARIGARAPGRVEILNFDEGSVVKQNEILAILEHADMDASLAASQASVARSNAALAEQVVAINQAESNLVRANSLWKQQSVSESERDQAKFSYEAAVARKLSLAAEVQLAVARQTEAEQLKENMFIRAPFDGTVISKDAEVGESILPGGMGEASGRGSVATIADLEHLEVECDVKEDFINRVTEGGNAEVTIDAVPGRKYHGIVRKIIPMGDRARATIKVQVEISDADNFLFPDMSGTVYFLPAAETDAQISEAPRLFCAASAVATDKSGQSFVWMVDADSRAIKVAVKVGPTRDNRTEILDGLGDRDKVIANPDLLVEGQLVKLGE